MIISTLCSLHTSRSFCTSSIASIMHASSSRQLQASERGTLKEIDDDDVVVNEKDLSSLSLYFTSSFRVVFS